MAYRPSGKDDLHLGFFLSELQKEEDIYTEFVSINYESEDPKRTLYFLKYNPHYKEEYEMGLTSSGHERFLVPVNELKVLNDVTSRGKTIDDFLIEDFAELPNPDIPKNTSEDYLLVQKLEEINQTLKTLTKVINNKIK